MSPVTARLAALRARHGLRHIATLAVIALAALVGLAFAARSLRYGLLATSPVPNMDQWEFVGALMRRRSGLDVVRDLFEQQNEHRLVTARIHFWIDYAVFHLGNLSVVATNYALMALLAALLAAVATRGRGLAVKAAVLALALPAMWSLAGWINLLWAFQIQWAYVHLMPALSIVAFAAGARAPGRRAWALLALACIADLLGVFSMASGLVTLGPIVAVAVWTRARPAYAAAMVAFHALATALFLHGFVFLTQPVYDPVRVLRYLAPYLGAAFPASKRVAILAGGTGLALGLAAMLAATLVALRRRPLGGAAASLLGVALFVVCEGVVTAVGRAGLYDPGGPTALALRYGTPSQVYWTALCLLAWSMLDRRGLRPRWQAAAAVAAALLVAATNLAGRKDRDWDLWITEADNTGYAMVNGVVSGPALALAYPDTEALGDAIRFLRERQIGPFAESEGRFRPPMNSLGAVALADLPACHAGTDFFRLRAGTQAHLRGWAVVPGLRRAPDWVAAFAGDGRLLGFSRPYFDAWDPARATGQAIVRGYDFWFAVPAAEAGRPVSLVATFPPGTRPPCRADLPAPVVEAP